VPADLDVSGCFDNAASANTSRATGKVIPSTGSADQFYYRYTDQLAKDASGSWQVVSDLPAVYYPRAKECKP
jgi:ketosteroid isomerase-like protein